MTEGPLPALASVAEIQRRLLLIFPEGSQNRTYCTRERAARTVYSMLYIGAVVGAQVWLAPKHVYRMTEEQAEATDPEARRAYATEALRPGFTAEGRPWYADNTREPIRDETLREGLIAVGAAIQRTDLPTTSSRPRYALSTDFAALFDARLGEDAFLAAIDAWQGANLSKGALTRLMLRRHLARDTFAWFASEPDKLIALRDGEIEINELMRLSGSAPLTGG